MQNHAFHDWVDWNLSKHGVATSITPWKELFSGGGEIAVCSEMRCHLYVTKLVQYSIEVTTAMENSNIRGGGLRSYCTLWIGWNLEPTNGWVALAV